MYAESTKILFVEFNYFLEHVLRLVSGIQEHTDTIVLLSSAEFGLVMLKCAMKMFVFFSAKTKK